MLKGIRAFCGMPPEIERMITDNHQNHKRMNILSAQDFDLEAVE
jgi:hypothetical protein